MQHDKVSIISLNIATVFKNLDYRSFSIDDIKKALSQSEEPEVVSVNFPVQYHVFSLKKSNFQITLEDQRLIVDDRSTQSCEKSELVAKFLDLHRTSFKGFELAAIGFNYVVRVETTAVGKFLEHANSLFGNDFLKSAKLAGYDASVKYHRDHVAYQTQVSLLPGQALGINFNAHHEWKTVPDAEALQNGLSGGWAELMAVINAL